MSNELKAKVTFGLGAVLSFPVVRGVSDGTIPLASAAIRVAIAMLFAYGAVSLLAWIVGSYLPEPAEPEEQPTSEGKTTDGIEDAVLVDEQPPTDAP